MKILLNIIFVLVFTISCKLQVGSLNSVLDIYLDSTDEISRKIVNPNTTTVLLETTAITFVTSTSNFDIKVKGFDASRLTLDNTKGKVNVFIRNVIGLKYSEAQTNSLFNNVSNLKLVDLDDIGSIPSSAFTIALNLPNTVSITANSSLMDRLRKKIVFVGDAGVFKVTLEFYDNNKEKSSYTADLFILVKRTS